MMMEDIIVTQENVERYSGDAIIRMKDYGEFFGKRIGRMQMVLDIVRECEVMVQYVGVKPEFFIILKPFNSYGVVVQDTTRVEVDSINFIGPLLKN